MCFVRRVMALSFQKKSKNKTMKMRVFKSRLASLTVAMNTNDMNGRKQSFLCYRRSTVEQSNMLRVREKSEV